MDESNIYFSLKKALKDESKVIAILRMIMRRRRIESGSYLEIHSNGESFIP